MPTAAEVTDILGVPQSVSVMIADSELQKLNEQELKAAIVSAWKKHEQLAKAEMAPLLYWLRERLRAQGARNDIADRDRGWGFWVERKQILGIWISVVGYFRQRHDVECL